MTKRSWAEASGPSLRISGNFDTIPQITKKEKPLLCFRVTLPGDWFVAGFTKLTRRVKRSRDPDKAIIFTERNNANKVAKHFGAYVEAVT